MAKKGEVRLPRASNRTQPRGAEELAAYLGNGGQLHVHDRGLQWAVIFCETEFCRDNPGLCFRMKLKSVRPEAAKEA